MGVDRSINDRVTSVLTSSSRFRKNLKNKKKGKQEVKDREEDDENIKEKILKL